MTQDTPAQPPEPTGPAGNPYPPPPPDPAGMPPPGYSAAPPPAPAGGFSFGGAWARLSQYERIALYIGGSGALITLLSYILNWASIEVARIGSQSAGVGDPNLGWLYIASTLVLIAAIGAALFGPPAFRLQARIAGASAAVLTLLSMIFISADINDAQDLEAIAESVEVSYGAGYFFGWLAFLALTAAIVIAHLAAIGKLGGSVPAPGAGPYGPPAPPAA